MNSVIKVGTKEYVRYKQRKKLRYSIYLMLLSLFSVAILAFYNFGCCFLEIFPFIFGILLFKSSRDPKITHSKKLYNFLFMITSLKCAVMFFFSVFAVATFGQYKHMQFGQVFLTNGSLYIGLGSFILILLIIIQFLQIVVAVYVKIFKEQADGDINKAMPRDDVPNRDTSQLDKSVVMNSSQVDISKIQLAPNLNVTSSRIVLEIDNEASFSKSTTNR